MKFYIKMPSKLIPYYKQEIALYKSYLDEANFQLSWKHLERAHILAQKYPLEHTAVHWKMLLFGIKIKKTKEIIGQIPRLLVGGIKSFVGSVPVGNTGGSNVPPLKRMEIDSELLQIINSNS
ncbi:MAG: DUF3703 domain-containing protein [Flavobacterium sp.]|uniref:DUF3703 domain-containing protein n=1 Tax=Flavobacterium sp. TaxID=239 RepID=UPI0022CAC848|nr:DUF3703 domain-containing protein [Flavobacterium sp.]MCZ8198697.1 DUF3703 domain-containing protein [Flavobacterium sp.]